MSGRDALCAGKDDLSSEEEHAAGDGHAHTYAKPDAFKKLLESGAIPDASMIHLARKRRQRARELGDFVALEEEDTGKSQKRCDDINGDGSEEDEEKRVDMSDITGKRDLEERREKFYQAQECKSICSV